jgi:hypothetical protein
MNLIVSFFKKLPTIERIASHPQVDFDHAVMISIMGYKTLSEFRDDDILNWRKKDKLITNTFGEAYKQSLNQLKALLADVPEDQLDQVDDGVEEYVSEVVRGSKSLVNVLKAAKSKSERRTEDGSEGANFFVPNIAITNSALAVTARAKNEMRLLSEVASFMADMGIEKISDQNAELVVEYLNGGGDENPYFARRKLEEFEGGRGIQRSIERRKNHLVRDDDGNLVRKIYFNTENVKPLMAKVLTTPILKTVLDFCRQQGILEINPEFAESVVMHLEGVGHNDYFTSHNVVGIIGDALHLLNRNKEVQSKDITSIAHEIEGKVEKLEEIYDAERNETNRDRLQERIDQMDEEGVIEDDEEMESRRLNIYVNENTDEVESFDVHSSFHDCFNEIRQIVDTMTYSFSEKHDRLVDPVTGARLVSVDERGLPEVHGVGLIFSNAPQQNIRSDDLHKIFVSDENTERRVAHRSKRSDREIARILLEDIPPDAMRELSIDEFHYQSETTREVDEDILNQIANDAPVPEGFDANEAFDDVAGEDDDQARNIPGEVEDIEDPGARMEQPPEDDEEEPPPGGIPPGGVMPPPGAPPQGPPQGPPGGGFEGFGDFMDDFEIEDDEEEGEEEGRQASKEVINNLLKLSQE